MGAGVVMNDEVLPPMRRFMQELVRDSSRNLCKEETTSTTASPPSTNADASAKSVLDFVQEQRDPPKGSAGSIRSAPPSLAFDMSNLVLVSDNARVFAKARPKANRSNKDLLSSQSWHSSRELRKQFTADARWGGKSGVDSSISPPLSSRRNVSFGLQQPTSPPNPNPRRSYHQRRRMPPPIRRQTSDSCLTVPTRDWMQQPPRRLHNDQPPKMIRSKSYQSQQQQSYQQQQPNHPQQQPRQPLVSSRFAASASPLGNALMSRLPPLSASSDDNDDDSVDSFESFSDADLVATAAAMVQSMPSNSPPGQPHGNRKHRDSIQVVHRAKSKAHMQQQQEQRELQQRRRKHQQQQQSMRRPKQTTSPPRQPFRYKEAAGCSPSSSPGSQRSHSTSIPQALSLFAETLLEHPSTSGSERSERSSSRRLGSKRRTGSKKKKPLSRSSSSSSSHYLNSGSNHSIESLELALGDLAPTRRKDRGCVGRTRSSRY